MVILGNGRRLNLQQVLNRLDEQHNFTERAIAARLPPTYLTDFLQPLVDDDFGPPLYISDLRSRLMGRFEAMILLAAQGTDYRFSALDIALGDISVTISPGLEVAFPPEGRCHVQIRKMQIEVTAAVHGDPVVAARHDLGFVQTVRRLERKVTWKKAGGGATKVLRAWLDKPHKDGPAGYTPLWYDDGAKTQLKQEPHQMVSASMADQPGMDWRNDRAWELERISGGEAFSTWLVLYDRVNDVPHFLRCWEWHVDYTHALDSIHRFGARYDSLQQYANGVGAVLDGPTAKAGIKSELRDFVEHVTTFEEMKVR